MGNIPNDIIAYNLYKKALSCTINGGHDIQYASMHMNNKDSSNTLHIRTVLFPILSQEQFVCYCDVCQQCLSVDNAASRFSGKRKEEWAYFEDFSYHNSWDYFKECFSIREEDFCQDNEIDDDQYFPPKYVILVYHDKAMPVRLIWEDRIEEKANIQYQLMRLFYRSSYYRFSCYGGYLSLYDGQPVNQVALFALFRNRFDEKTFSTDGLFYLYIIHQLCYRSDDEIKGMLDKLSMCDDEISQRQWYQHTLDVLLVRESNLLSPEQKHCVDFIVEVCKGYINPTSQGARQIENCSPAYFDTGNSVEKLTEMYQALVDNHFLDPTTELNDFLYYFGANIVLGDLDSPLLPLPTKKLRWIGENKILAIFLGELGVDDVWKNASLIFDNVKVGSLKTACSVYKSQKRDTSGNYDEVVRNTERKLKMILLHN